MISYTTVIFFCLLLPSIILLGTCLLMVASNEQGTETIYCVIAGSGGIIISSIFGHINKEIICHKQRVEIKIACVQSIPITEVIETEVIETEVIEEKEVQTLNSNKIAIPIANMV